MKKKLVLGALAGAAAVALAVGGTTYAAFSDSQDVTGNEVGAGVLKLSLADNAGGDMKFDHVKMAPGGIASERQVYIASNSGSSTPSAILSFSLTDLVGEEDGCQGGEATVDSACSTPGTGANMGQFIEDALVQTYSYIPNTPGHCNQNYTSSSTVVRGQWGGSLKDIAGATDTALGGSPRSLMSQDVLPIATPPAGRVVVPWLAPGYGMCFAMTVELPYGVDNASQGDSASFNIHFDLTQAPYGTPVTQYTGVGAPSGPGWVAAF